MREIKFRAWCEEDKSMYYPDGNYEFHIYSNSISYSPRYDQHELYSYSTDKSEFEKEILVMQFTGLKDKNGKEIYEGDIMCWPEYEGKKFQTRWVVEWNGKRAGWSDWSPKEKAEVIGNIYENPELLK